ncbi:hypothetical protein CYMTET_16470 [Cymbomonas tetramitiformis]|uniref:Uncharacterized protein n=1 Tax=Cymbomonas tetramitiformis TaxID=36881 RepID=A0AAE0GC34_9CHLO|nr:hypothetical protein CYMTET_16470 [Cymbomonas tetramitiformis]|eukprot:gene16568-19680_t
MGADDLGQDGLPAMDVAERDSNEAKGRKMFMFIMVAPVALGLGLGSAIYNFGDTSAYDKKISLVVAYDLQFAYLAAFVFCRLVSFLNMYPMIAKSRVMRGKSGNLRANMYLYREYGSGKIVTLDDGEETGRYNRANRSLHHFTENMGGFLVGMVLAGFCFPFPVFVMTCTFAIGRIMHQIGYSNKGYGGHGAGFGIATLSTAGVEGLILLTALMF